MAQASDFPAAQWMNSIDSAFGSVDMEPAAAKINLIPTEAVAVAGPLAGGFLESLDHLGVDLTVRKVFFANSVMSEPFEVSGVFTEQCRSIP